MVETIVASGVAALAALGGVLLQASLERRRGADQRATDHEDWVRDLRKEAHVAFLAEASRLNHFISMYTRVGGPGVTPDDPNDGWVQAYPDPLPDDWWRPLLAKLTGVEVHASAEAAQAAREVFDAIREGEAGTVGGMMAMDQRIDEYRRLVQTDLDIEPTTFPAPPDVATEVVVEADE